MGGLRKGAQCILFRQSTGTEKEESKGKNFITKEGQDAWSTRKAALSLSAPRVKVCRTFKVIQPRGSGYSRIVKSLKGEQLVAQPGKDKGISKIQGKALRWESVTLPSVVPCARTSKAHRQSGGGGKMYIPGEGGGFKSENRSKERRTIEAGEIRHGGLRNLLGGKQKNFLKVTGVQAEQQVTLTTRERRIRNDQLFLGSEKIKQPGEG